MKITCIHSGLSPGKSVRELAHFSRCQIGAWIQVWSEARGLFSSHGVRTKACARHRWGGDNVAHRRAERCWHLSPQLTTAPGWVTASTAGRSRVIGMAREDCVPWQGQKEGRRILQVWQVPRRSGYWWVWETKPQHLCKRFPHSPAAS